MSIFTNIDAALKQENIGDKVRLVERVTVKKPVKWYTGKECHPIVGALLKKQNTETAEKKQETEETTTEKNI